MPHRNQPPVPPAVRAVRSGGVAAAQDEPVRVRGGEPGSVTLSVLRPGPFRRGGRLRAVLSGAALAVLGFAATVLGPVSPDARRSISPSASLSEATPGPGANGAELSVADVSSRVLGLLAPPPAHAAKRTHEDRKLGFRLKIDADWVQVPPKLTSGDAFVVGEWYEDSAKFDAGLRPEFKVCWWAEAKGAAVTGGPAPAPGTPDAPTPPAAPPAPPTVEDMRQQWAEMNRAKDIDAYASRYLDQEYFFGPPVPIADRWKQAEKDKMRIELGGKNKLVIEYFEVNNPTKWKGKGKPPAAYALVGRLKLERPAETVNVGFLANCEFDHAKKMRNEFFAILRSFEDLRTGSDALNRDAQDELSMDPAKFREEVKKRKVIKGWKARDTENYLLVYSEEVDPGLVSAVAVQIEAIRAQIYEVLFPPDAPMTAVSVVRICKDQEQYFAYGGPGGSAGYWAPGERELVFYDDGTKDSLRVLYHEAFHQYIFYSVGDFSPHSWFNEGHGDFFAGHDFSGGKFQRGKFQWRVGEAKTWKGDPKRPPLQEWLGWTQGQYYGGNEQGIPGGANYALGWSFIYFLRGSKNPAYQKILPVYFNTLKGHVTASRERAKAREKAMEEWRKKVEADPATAGGPPEFDPSADDERKWLEDALAKAFHGIDMEKLEKDWLDD